MKLVVNIIAVVILVTFCLQLVISVPINIDDPCDLQKLENISACEANDEKCKLKKQQILCEENPNCYFCGTSNVNNEIEDVIDPEIIDAIEIPKTQEGKLIERNIIIENDNETQYYRGYVDSAANITTVIRLTNLINNTNIINMPTTLNNTNVNNIHVYQNNSSGEGGKFGLGYTDKGSCCYSIQPKMCKHSTAGLKCRHKRRKVCGHQCTQKVIHLNHGPSSPRNLCRNIPQWPYMICNQNTPQYQPGFNPGYYAPPAYPGYAPQYDADDDDDDFPLFPTDEELEDPESGWVVSAEKCKVVSEDGLQITNCTQQGFEFEHPYAKNTVSEPIKRKTRQIHYPGAPMQYQNPMMQQGMQPMMYQPIYIQPPMYPVMYQPMPMYIPQYYQPPPPIDGYYQPQQISSPPVERFQSEDESIEINPSQQEKKQTKKHHQPIVMDIDKEL